MLAVGVWSWATADPVRVALPTSTTSAADPEGATAAPPAAPVGTWTAGAPRSLVAPAAGIRARVAPVRTRGSVLLPPADPGRLGWWSDGAPVGAGRGTALLAGHAVSGGGGALDEVSALEPGDRLTARNDEGPVDYRVMQVVTLGKDELAARSSRLFRQEGRHRLALVTCADWDGTAFRSNTVVLAEPAQSSP